MANNRVHSIVVFAVMYVLASTLIVGPGASVLAQRVATVPSEASYLSPRVTIDADTTALKTVLQVIAQKAGLAPIFETALIPAGIRITLHAHQIPADEAFRQALSGTGLVARVRAGKYIAIVRESSVPTMTGIIVGAVTDAKTRQPIAEATVSLDAESRGVMTDQKGGFRLANIADGPHVVRVKRVGYMKQTRAVMMRDGETSTVDVALEPSASMLDQVVVTGTVVQTELKAVPNAMTVITAKDIEQRGITHIDQLFRGDVPGLFALGSGSSALFDEVTMFSRGATALSSASAGVSSVTNYTTNPIKTYVDGVELADPRYLSQIDPKSIERIEVLTGPQASTIYGSNAINGVMQIFTKRGTTSTPELTLNLQSGWVENNFSNARTPQHDYSGQLNGIEGRLSYNAGGSWNYIGPWTPAKQTTRTSGSGGARLELPTGLGRINADVTFRRSITQNHQRGDAVQGRTGYRESGWWQAVSGAGRIMQATDVLAGQTLGVTLGYAPTDWWSQELGLGQDAVDLNILGTTRGYVSASDTLLILIQTHADRRSLRYTTTTRIPMTSLVQTTAILGADAWQNLASSLNVQPQALTGTLTGSTSIFRQPGHNAGGFLQTQLALHEQLFVTYGLRAEWNPDYGADAQPNYAPRYGVAYTQELGTLTAKLRASYGRSTRPPASKLKVAQTYAQAGFVDAASVEQDYGVFNFYVANPALAPEHQQGGEGGLELYWGTRGSLVATRYNQTVDGLIDAPKVDSVRSLTTTITSYYLSKDANGYGYAWQYQYLNVGSIRNQGWELQGTANTGPFTTRGTYSWTKSRTLGVSPKYRSFFTPISYPQYQPGATFQYLPEHTWALGITYARAQTTVGLNVSGIGLIKKQTDDFFLRNLNGSIRLPQNRLNVTRANQYVNFTKGYALADLTASHRFMPRIEGLLQIRNLVDHYTNDRAADFAALGRQLMLGMRLR